MSRRAAFVDALTPVLVIVVGVLLVSGCRVSVTIGEPPSATPAVFRLHTVPVSACERVSASGALRGDPDDPQLTWLESDGTRHDVVWPRGYTARFEDAFGTPGLLVFGPDGQLVAGDSDWYPYACKSGIEIAVLLMSAKDMGLDRP